MKSPRAAVLFCVALACVLPASCAPRETAEPVPVSETTVPEDPANDIVLSETAVPEEPPALPATPAPIAFKNGAAYPPDTTQLSVVLDEDEFDQLDRFPALTFVDLTGTPCCPALLQWTEAHPDITVKYTVPLGGVSIANDAAQAEVPTLSDPALLGYLPALKTLTVTQPMTPDAALALLNEQAELDLHYTVKVRDLLLESDMTELDAAKLSPACADDLAAAIPALPKLELPKLELPKLPKIG